MTFEIEPSDSPSDAVKRFIARKEECNPSQLGDLGQAVYVDRLDTLRDPPIEFQYSGYHVTVTGDGTIKIDP